LVDLMGGKISLESEPGVGTTFRFSLPFCQAQTSGSVSEIVSSLQSRRLLVVDDVKVNRELIEAFGGRWGLSVETAPSAEKARQLLQVRAPYDFIILDYQMPGEDGATLARSLREDHRFAHIPRLLLSSVTEPSEHFESGLFQVVLHKPIRPSKLKTQLSLLLKKSAPLSPPRSSGPVSSAAGLKVLLAEDNPNNQTVLRLMMKRLGCEFTIVENGAQAVEAAETQPFDIILLDVQMPVMDGLTAVGKIRERFMGKDQRPYLVSLTANAFAEDQKACLAAGFDFYLAKPVTLHQLEDVFIRRPVEVQPSQ
jgi:CheY-like chemotaxis protein